MACLLLRCRHRVNVVSACARKCHEAAEEERKVGNAAVATCSCSCLNAGTVLELYEHARGVQQSSRERKGSKGVPVASGAGTVWCRMYVCENGCLEVGRKER
jgi:hypothetical protein